MKAGFRALAQGGPAAVKVEALARDLGATKGSFYWHFKDSAALKQGMLALWQDLATQQVVARIASAGGAHQQIAALAQEAAQMPDHSFGGPLIEAAIRDWGRYDADVRQCIETVDRDRMAFVTGLFVALGLSAGEAGQRAGLLYAAYVGMMHLGTLAADAPGGGLAAVAERLLATL